MNKQLFSKLSDDILAKIHTEEQPDFVVPMLATLTTNYFSSDEWLYEHKFDGVRCLAFKKNGLVKLMSRNRKLMNKQYPEITHALENQKADNFIIDGEIVAVDKHGISDFQLLQGRMNLRNAHLVEGIEKTMPIIYRVFDVIYTDGYNLCALPLYARKIILERLIHSDKTISLSEFHVGDGIALFRKACSLKWEGIIAKNAHSAYVYKRSRDWLKFKCKASQELVIGGFTQPRASRQHFGALLVGYYEKNKLYYAGKVGTGYSQETLALLAGKLNKIITKKCPFADYDESVKGVTWVKPTLVADFDFAQWTQAGRLRVGRYKGLRNDKKAKDVVRELKD